MGRGTSGIVRAAMAGLAVLLVLLTTPHALFAMGDSGAFNPRILLTGSARLEGDRTSAPARWSWELVRRTSAPARLSPGTVRADSSGLLAEPFAIWLGDRDPGPLSQREVSMLQTYFAMGGVLFVDDIHPEDGAFGRSARRELARVLPDVHPIPIGTEHVVFRSFYLLPRPYGRLEGPAKLEAIVRGGVTSVILASHDLAGALAQTPSGAPSFPTSPGGDEQRETAVRLAVNIAMFVLCSNYKDDQVHAPFLMRRRARDRR